MNVPINIERKKKKEEKKRENAKKHLITLDILDWQGFSSLKFRISEKAGTEIRNT